MNPAVRLPWGLRFRLTDMLYPASVRAWPLRVVKSGATLTVSLISISNTNHNTVARSAYAEHNLGVDNVPDHVAHDVTEGFPLGTSRSADGGNPDLLSVSEHRKGVADLFE
ncbi:hypothetical protein BaRGS_00024302 [Batillaria attramentaria]|uniref:Uncharacterized protein n=1 Tax=Batillaria attramentaria TaxID=370345 RepID=A0ABD0KBG0_9CAEN